MGIVDTINWLFKWGPRIFIGLVVLAIIYVIWALVSKDKGTYGTIRYKGKDEYGNSMFDIEVKKSGDPHNTYTGHTRADGTIEYKNARDTAYTDD